MNRISSSDFLWRNFNHFDKDKPNQKALWFQYKIRMKRGFGNCDQWPEEPESWMTKIGAFLPSLEVLKSQFYSPEKPIIMLIGMPSAGKKTMLKQMVTVFPTSNVVDYSFRRRVEFKQYRIHFSDLGVRPIMKYTFYREVSAMAFIVDANDHQSIETYADGIEDMMGENLLQKLPVLVLANKMDLPNAMDVHELADKLRLHEITNRRWYIQPIIATQTKGVIEGFDWLENAIKHNQKRQ
eukprot:TRINITY_DN14208_c0_g1_i1.p1 TRINITY_DN14208_c0_g1~~TRINITY_DN14208_c0_g1_i1.p1  ORF type:complete len:277 (-),score=46.52 TRINITY_DN14208_c0_g1_i1:4-720(-)